MSTVAPRWPRCTRSTPSLRTRLRSLRGAVEGGAFALIGLSLLGCSSGPKPAQPQPADGSARAPGNGKAPAAAAVSSATRWQPPRSPEGVHALEAVGRLLPPPNSRAELTMPLPATVLHVFVVPGRTVERGEVLLDVAVPQAASAEGQLAGARLRENALQARLSRLQQLSQEGLVRASEIAEARARLADAQAVAREAQALLGAVRAAGLRRRGEKCELRSPIAGVVVEVNAPLGSVRGPGDGPVVTISGGQPTRVEARFAFPLPRDAAYVLIDDAQQEHPLSLVSQAPEVMPQDAMRLTWFDAQAPLALPHGAAVRVQMRPPKDAWVVPASALLREGVVLRVLTAKRGAVAVELMAPLGSEMLVRGALTAGDLVAEDPSAVTAAESERVLDN